MKGRISREPLCFIVFSIDGKRGGPECRAASCGLDTPSLQADHQLGSCSIVLSDDDALRPLTGRFEKGKSATPVRALVPTTVVPAHLPNQGGSAVYLITPQAMRVPPPPDGSGWSA
jgi:hypothetical protein